jgi:hypothetical protein
MLFSNTLKIKVGLTYLWATLWAALWISWQWVGREPSERIQYQPLASLAKPSRVCVSLYFALVMRIKA